MEAFRLTPGRNEKLPDGTFLHGPLKRDGQEASAASEPRNDALSSAVMAHDLKTARPIKNYGIGFDSAGGAGRAFHAPAE